MAMLLRSLRARVIARGARNFRAYADLAVAYEERDWSSNGTANRVHAHAQRAGGRDHALERAVHALDLEDRARRSRPAARWSSSRPSGRRSRARSSPTSPTEAGFPPGVFNVVQGIGEEVGAALVADPRVAPHLASPARPRRAARSPRPPRATSCPSPPSSAARGRCSSSRTPTSRPPPRKAAGQYDDAGQVCLAGTRLLVEEPVAERFLELFHRFADEHVLGDPRDDATTISPLIHREHLERVEGFVERARAAGDEIVRGGRRLRGARRALVRADARRSRARTSPRSSSARCSGRC